MHPAPNAGSEPTPYSLRSAAAFGRGSLPAFGFDKALVLFLSKFVASVTYLNQARGMAKLLLQPMALFPFPSPRFLVFVILAEIEVTIVMVASELGLPRGDQQCS